MSEASVPLETEKETSDSGAAFPELTAEPEGANGPAEAFSVSDSAAAENEDPDTRGRTAAELATVFDVPVRVSAVLGRTRITVSELVGLRAGKVLPLDRKVGEAVDIFVNDRLVARGEVVLIDDRLGITMTEIVKTAAR